MRERCVCVCVLCVLCVCVHGRGGESHRGMRPSTRAWSWGGTGLLGWGTVAGTYHFAGMRLRPSNCAARSSALRVSILRKELRDGLHGNSSRDTSHSNDVGARTSISSFTAATFLWDPDPCTDGVVEVEEAEDCRSSAAAEVGGCRSSAAWAGASGEDDWLVGEGRERCPSWEMVGSTEVMMSTLMPSSSAIVSSSPRRAASIACFTGESAMLSSCALRVKYWRRDSVAFSAFSIRAAHVAPAEALAGSAMRAGRHDAVLLSLEGRLFLAQGCVRGEDRCLPSILAQSRSLPNSAATPHFPNQFRNPEIGFRRDRHAGLTVISCT